MIKLEGITKSFGSLQVLKGIDLEINKGEIVSIVGPSGAGKTTLLQIMGTLDEPDAGTVEFDGTVVSRMKEKELSAFRNKHIGFVFQFFDLVPEFTAAENILLPQVLSRKPVDREHYSRLISVLGIGDFENRLPSELSGGEQQRVAIARSLIRKPRLVLMDEPTGNLDENNTEIVRSLIRRLRDDFGMTVVYVTHDRHMAEAADTVISMRDGVIGDMPS